MTRQKVINESLQYTFYCYDEAKNGPLNSKYKNSSIGPTHPLKNGDTGTIEARFYHPNGDLLVILKMDDLEDVYTVIDERGLGSLDADILPRPEIQWENLVSTTKMPSIELKGKVKAIGNIIEFKIYSEPVDLDADCSFSKKMKLKIGKNYFHYWIRTDTPMGINGNIVIECTAQPAQEIFKNLKAAGLLKWINELENKKIIEKALKESLQHGRLFFIDPLYTYYDIEGETLVEDGFKSYLEDIGTGLKKRNCPLNISEEYQDYDTQVLSENGEKQFTHWIIVNGKKYVIFQGFLGETAFHQIYFNQLTQMVEDILIAGNRPERVGLFTSADGVSLALLSPLDFNSLKAICENLENQFTEPLL